MDPFIPYSHVSSRMRKPIHLFLYVLLFLTSISIFECIKYVVDEPLPIIDVLEGDSITSNIPSSSTVTIRGNFQYKLEYFCLRPHWQGGLILYGYPSSETSLPIQNEIRVTPFPFTAVSSPPPKNAIWINSSTAVIQPFTYANIYHTMNSIIQLANVLNDPDVKFTNNRIHLHFVLPIKEFRKKRERVGTDRFRLPLRCPFPLAHACIPSNVDAVRVRLYEDKNEQGRGNKEVCYTSGYLGGPYIRIPFSSANAQFVFKEGRRGVVDQFRSNVIRLVNGELVMSPWCKGEAESKPAVLILKRSNRCFLNLEEMVDVVKEEEYDSRVIELENLSYKDQILAFRAADVVLGIHGAGMTHGLWMMKGAVMIEVFPPGGPGKNGINKNPRRHFGVISRYVGLGHIGYQDPAIPDPKFHWRRQNVTLDSLALRELLKTAKKLLIKESTCPGRGSASTL